MFWVPILIVTFLVWWQFYEQVVRNNPQGTQPIPDWLAWVLTIVFGLGFPALGVLLRLVTELHPGQLRVRVFPFRGTSIPLKDVREAEVRDYSAQKEFGGWGVRTGRGGKAYTAYGNQGVQLWLKQRGAHPDRLAEGPRARGRPAPGGRVRPLTGVPREGAMRIVVALGGNALLKRGEPLTEQNQRENVRVAARALAPLAREHSLIITHGNGPQVGLLALEAASVVGVEPFTLDVLSAESEGMIGYMIEQELGNVLPEEVPFATILTQVEVDPADPAFQNPSKPIGPQYSREEAERLAREHGWTVGPDGDRYRRLVASPRPLRIFELRVVEWLVERGVIVICTGGGGIPTRLTPDGVLMGVEAVIDKDHAGRPAGPFAQGGGVPHAHRCRDRLAGLGHRARPGHPARVARRPRAAPFRRRLHGAQGGGGLRLRPSHRRTGRYRRPGGRRGYHPGPGGYSRLHRVRRHRVLAFAVPSSGAGT